MMIEKRYKNDRKWMMLLCASLSFGAGQS